MACQMYSKEGFEKCICQGNTAVFDADLRFSAKDGELILCHLRSGMCIRGIFHLVKKISIILKYKCAWAG